MGIETEELEKRRGYKRSFRYARPSPLHVHPFLYPLLVISRLSSFPCSRYSLSSSFHCPRPFPELVISLFSSFLCHLSRHLPNIILTQSLMIQRPLSFPCIFPCPVPVLTSPFTLLVQSLSLLLLSHFLSSPCPYCSFHTSCPCPYFSFHTSCPVSILFCVFSLSLSFPCH